MVNKKLNRLLSSILGVALTIGIMEIPVLADNNVQAASSYSTIANLTENNNYIVSKNNSIEKNGLKISIDKIVATKHKLKATIIVQSQKPFDEAKGDNVITKLTYGENRYNGEGMSYGNIDDKTLKIDLERDVDDEELPEKGELRIDIVIPSYKVNVGLDVNVDFSESFKSILEKDISKNVPELNITLKKLESSIMGTTLVYSQPEVDYMERMKNGSRDLPFSGFILKVGDKMYKTRSDGGYSSSDNDGLQFGTYVAESATYEKVKDQKEVSIIPIVCDMTWDDMTKTYDEAYQEDYNKKREANKETVNNVSYVKFFEFFDGSKGEIYNIERNDDSLKVYCKGSSEAESLLMASNMFMYYNLGKDNLSYSSVYEDSQYISFYKDSKDSLGYVVEFNNVAKDKLIELDFDSVIKQIDKFKIGDEVKITE